MYQEEYEDFYELFLKLKKYFFNHEGCLMYLMLYVNVFINIEEPDTRIKKDKQTSFPRLQAIKKQESEKYC